MKPLINIDNSHDPANFTSTVNPSCVNPAALPEPSSNIAAANSQITGGKFYRGSKKNKMSRKYKKYIKTPMSKKFRSSEKRTMKNIKQMKNKTISLIKNLYKGTSKRLMGFSRKNKTRRNKDRKNEKNKKNGKRCSVCKGKKCIHRRRSYRRRGGYSQYQNNLPLTPTYSTGDANLGPNSSALASPPPYNVLSNCTNCVDNYNHFTGKGFPSKGH